MAIGPPLGRRIRAARVLAGLDSVPALAEALSMTGHRATKLYAYEQGRDTPDLGVIAEIAAVCQVPLAWFSVDYRRLPEIAPDARSVIAAEIAAARERSHMPPEASAEDPPPQSQAGP